MTLNSQAHYDLVDQFERDVKNPAAASGLRSVRLDREPKEMWARGRVYQDGYTNDLFVAYRLGCSYGTALALLA